MGSIQLRRTDSSDPDFAHLYGRLNEFLAVLNGEQNAFYAHLNQIAELPTVVVAYDGDEAIGCGAFRPVDDTTVEIKRMYVEPLARGKGAGAAILEELEAWAAELGYRQTILETSKRLDAAVSLYRRSGYAVIPNYGAYAGVDDSVCFAKTL